MINFKLKKTTFEGMKISLDEEILFPFDKGPNIMDVLFSFDLQDVTSLLKLSWNKLKDFALEHPDLNMEIRKFLEDKSFQNFDRLVLYYRPIILYIV